MNLVRKIKINKISPVEFTENEQDVIFFIEEVFKTLTIIKEDKSIFFINPDAVIILEEKIIDKSSFLFVNDDMFWDILNRKFKLIGSEIVEIIHYMAEDFFKMKLPEPICGCF